jgi:acyl-CoA synthetase (NDP forming)
MGKRLRRAPSRRDRVVLRRRRRLGGGCLRARRPRTCRCLDDATRRRSSVSAALRAARRTRSTSTGQAIHERGYAEFARLAAESPSVDCVILVVTGRHPRFLLEDRDHLIALGRDSKKPVLIWSYTRPAAVCVDLLSEAGLPLFTNVHNCARAMRVMADYRTAREKFTKG